MTARLVAGLTLCATLLGCTGARDRQSDSELRPVRLSFNPHISWAPFMIARAEGLFEEEGLDVEFVQALQSEETLVALVTGDIDVRPGPIHAAFLSAVAQGARVKLAAGMGVLDPDGCTYFGIVLRPGLDTTSTIARIRTSHDGVTRYIVSRMLARRGEALDRVETIRVPDAVLAVALETGSLDAAAVSEPALTRLRQKGTLWASAEDALPGFQWSVLAFGERFLERDRDTGERFLRAYHRAVAQYRLGKTERNVAIIADGTGETLEHTYDACWPTFTDNSAVNWESIAEFQTWANEQGFMERSISRAQGLDTTLVTASYRSVFGNSR
jgi:ABC-type nitrate/sulfonate/bicarbonate transport system substrate-binding protein